MVGRLAQVLEALGDVAEAQKLYMRELQGREELFGAGHKKTQRSRQKLENFLRPRRPTTLIHVESHRQRSYNCFNEPFAAWP